MYVAFYGNFRKSTLNYMYLRKSIVKKINCKLSPDVRLMFICFMTCNITVKFLNFRTPEKFFVIYLKFMKRGLTFGYFIKKMQIE